jgi:RNA polymerase sigma-70 factor, ECF subfamily
MSFTSPIAYRLACNASRLEVLGAEHGHDRILFASQNLEGLSGSAKDQLCTDLMGIYAAHDSQEAFALLYEFSQETVLSLVRFHLRRSFFPIDAYDVTQEVFVNAFKYPRNFDASKPTAFKNWVHSIARNTALKISRRAQRNQAISLMCRQADGVESPLEIEDTSIENPHDSSALKEDNENLTQAWMLYLHFYAQAFKTLSPQEKRVLHLVEVEELAYRDAANALELRIENLKMRIFRARRKIYNVMKRSFNGGEFVEARCTPKPRKGLLVGKVQKGAINVK